MELLSYLAVAIILFTYFKWGDWRFDLANAIGFLPIAVVSYSSGAYSAVLINTAFGLIGVYRLWKHRV